MNTRLCGSIAWPPAMKGQCGAGARWALQPWGGCPRPSGFPPEAMWMRWACINGWIPDLRGHGKTQEACDQFHLVGPVWQAKLADA